MSIDIFLKVDHVRNLAKRQKDRLEKEIQDLQAELQELQEKHFDEVGGIELFSALKNLNKKEGRIIADFGFLEKG